MSPFEPEQWRAAKAFTSSKLLFEALLELSAVPGKWLFRGQGKASWPLAPSIERRKPTRSFRVTESDLLYDFKRHSRSVYSNLPEFGDVPSWLSLMRHHGVPTRLLDWTNSAYIALFFACSDLASKQNPVGEINPGDSYASVWALDGVALSAAFQAKASELTHTPADGWDLSNPEHFKLLAWYLFDRQNEADGLVAEVLPRSSNERMSFQQGTFLATCNHNISFESSLRLMMTCSIAHAQATEQAHNEKPWVRQFAFPLELREEILKHLYDVNVHALTLFPDLDGLGRLLADKYHLFLSTPLG